MTKKDLRSLLSELGSTPDEIAKTLRKKRCKGGHGSMNCPVHNYLNRKLSCVVEACPERIFADGVSIKTPKAISDFIYEYDCKGKYPFLEYK